MSDFKFDPMSVKIGLVENLTDASMFWEWLTAGHDLIAFDIETDGLNWYDGKIRLCQFGDLTSGWAIPYEWYPRLVFEALEYLKAKRTLVVGHNVGGFDLTWTRHHLGHVPDWSMIHDTMILASLIDSAGSKALKDLSAAYVHPVAKIGQEMLHDDMKRFGFDWATVPVTLQSYFFYGVMDCILTANLFVTLLPIAQSIGLMDAYATERHVEKVMHQVSFNGMLLDQEHCRREAAILRHRIEEIKTIVWDRWGLENIGSGPQLSAAFQNNGVRLTIKTPSGNQYSMSQDALDIISAENQGHDLVGLVTEYRRAQKYASNYYDAFLRDVRGDGRCHPYYRQMHARTLRMSANTPPIQTVPTANKEPRVRNSFISRDGYSLISADQSNAEARIFSVLAPDPGMQATILSGQDLHCWIGGMMYNGGVPLEKKDPRRDRAKNSFFCVPQTVKIITRNGPKSHDELTIGQEVLGYDEASKTTKWTTLSAVNVFPDRQVLTMSNDHRSFTSTPDHRWFAQRRIDRGVSGRHYENVVTTTEQIKRDDRIILSAPYDAPERSDVSLDEVRLLAWFVTDGCVRWSSTGYGVSASITQNPKTKGGDSYKDITEMFERNEGWLRHIDHNPSGCHVFNVYPQVVRDLYAKCEISTKIRPTGLPKFVLSLGTEQARVFSETVFLAEGTITRGRRVLSQNRGETLLAMQLASFLTGRCPSRPVLNRTSYPTDKINWTYREGNPTLGASRLRFSEPFNEDVWCPTTELGSWVAMDDSGQVFITGNCCLFGGGEEVLAVTASITIPEAADTLRLLKRTFPSIRAHSQNMTTEAAMASHDVGRAGIRLRDGRLLRCTEDDERLYQFANYAIQGTARMILGERLIAMDNAGIMDMAVAVIHDEVVFEVPDPDIDEVRSLIGEYFPDHESFPVPMLVGVGNAAKRWADCDH